jgi:hypothetical protein
MNVQLKEIQSVLDSFRLKMSKLHETIAWNLDTLKPELAQEKNDSINEEIFTLYKEYHTKMVELGAKIQDKVLDWASLNGSDVTDDIKLLNSNFTLDANQVQELADRHQDNATMLHAIKSYAREREIPVITCSVEDKIEAYNKIIQSNCTLLAGLRDNPNSDLYKYSIDNLGSPEQMSPQFLMIIGDGTEL